MKRVLDPVLIIYSIIFFITPLSLSAEPQESAQSAEKKIDIDKYPNQSLIQVAWDYYNRKDYNTALLFAERSIAIYDTGALEIQASLKKPFPQEKTHQYWMLNDVATAKFIKGKVLWLRGDRDGAKNVLNDIINNYSYAMAYDLHGWFWSVSNAARDMLKAMELGIDFGDSSSSYLTSKAWEAYGKKEYKAALGYAQQCINMYKEAAVWQQKGLLKYPKKEEIPKYWALNDVGTCLFIAVKSSQKLNKDKEARDYAAFLKDRLSYASCWDPKGWYWKIADGLKKK